jgi:Macrocin-O-methyltransferase (TylF)
MYWKASIKRLIPPALLNNFLLTFPVLYHTELVYYETNLHYNHGIEDLLAQLNPVLDIEGDIIECGSSRCGASIIMAKHLQSKQVHKTIYACDSFEGFDPAELERERRDGLANASDSAFTSTSYEYVKRKIKKLSVENMVVPVKGFFQQTLPYLNSNLCFALIDCDLQDSIIYTAETIWPKLVNSGRIVFDDYTAEYYLGARLGIDYFINKYRREIAAYGLMNRLYYACKK